jgi:hypothetical protein
MNGHEKKWFSKEKLEICFYCILPLHRSSSTIIIKQKNKKINTCTSTLLMDRAPSLGRLRLHKILNPFLQHRVHDLADRFTTEALITLRIFAKRAKNWKRKLCFPEFQVKA